MYILQDPYYDSLPITKAMPALMIALAQAYFGEDILRVSSVTGTRNIKKLDYRIMAKIENHIRKKFEGRVSEEAFPDCLKLCRSLLSTKCKKLRYEAKPKFT